MIRKMFRAIVNNQRSIMLNQRCLANMIYYKDHGMFKDKNRQDLVYEAYCSIMSKDMFYLTDDGREVYVRDDNSMDLVKEYAE